MRTYVIVYELENGVIETQTFERKDFIRIELFNSLLNYCKQEKKQLKKILNLKEIKK